jgi:hypothetical protein
MRGMRGGISPEMAKIFNRPATDWVGAVFLIAGIFLIFILVKLKNE